VERPGWIGCSRARRDADRHSNTDYAVPEAPSVSDQRSLAVTSTASTRRHDRLGGISQADDARRPQPDPNGWPPGPCRRTFPASSVRRDEVAESPRRVFASRLLHVGARHHLRRCELIDLARAADGHAVRQSGSLPPHCPVDVGGRPRIRPRCGSRTSLGAGQPDKAGVRQNGDSQAAEMSPSGDEPRGPWHAGAWTTSMETQGVVLAWTYRRVSPWLQLYAPGWG
jgi:hypothetical protein